MRHSVVLPTPDANRPRHLRGARALARFLAVGQLTTPMLVLALSLLCSCASALLLQPTALPQARQSALAARCAAPRSAFGDVLSAKIKVGGKVGNVKFKATFDNSEAVVVQYPLPFVRRAARTLHYHLCPPR